ncbi:MAG: hypothetical protein RR969_09205 [Thermomonas sp.]
MNNRLPAYLLSCVCFLASADACAQNSTEAITQTSLISCGQGSLRYLPGDYYFRVGHKAFEAGNSRKAISMFESSAAWGDKRAMFNMGLILYRGSGVTKNEPLGMAWLALSAERSTDQAHRKVLASAWQAATQETRDSATAMWNEMKLKYADRVALTRARQHYFRRTSTLRSSFLSDPVMIDGMCGVTTIGEALQALDDIAADSIQRPRTTLRGKVIVGPMENADRPPAKPPNP